jgi:hypothetical protein
MKVMVQLTGKTALVQHNVRLADKLDEYTKAIAEITGKRKKTEADNADVERLEWFGGLYHTKDKMPGPDGEEVEIGIYVPVFNVIRCFEEAAKITRQGKTLIRALAFADAKLPLHHEGPPKPEKLWALPEYRWRTTVGIQGKKITRVRPIFRRWSLDFEMELLEDVMSPDDLRRIIDLAGRSEGLGDARKLGYGRFTAEVVM